MPKLTEADRELLKLMTSDLWNFVTDDKMDKNLQKAVEFIEDDDDFRPRVDYQEIKKLRNLSNPRGKKLVVYE